MVQTIPIHVCRRLQQPLQTVLRLAHSNDRNSHHTMPRSHPAHMRSAAGLGSANVRQPLLAVLKLVHSKARAALAAHAADRRTGVALSRSEEARAVGVLGVCPRLLVPSCRCCAWTALSCSEGGARYGFCSTLLLIVAAWPKCSLPSSAAVAL